MSRIGKNKRKKLLKEAGVESTKDEEGRGTFYDVPIEYFTKDEIIDVLNWYAKKYGPSDFTTIDDEAFSNPK